MDTVAIADDNPGYDITSHAEIVADSILISMTLEERVGQCLMPALYASSDKLNLQTFRQWIDDYHIGGVMLMNGNLFSAKEIAEVASKTFPPLFVAIDAEWGLGMRLEDAPVYPKNGKISKEEEESHLYDYGREIAEEARKTGINMILGPVLDVVGPGKNIIGSRSFGENVDIVSNFGVAYSKGLESGKVISIAKHFPGHGHAINDSHVTAAKSLQDISAMDSIDLRPFRDYINAGLSGVMAGHIQAQALDPSGKVASASEDIMKSLLREEMGFKGLIITDALNMGGARGFSAADALKAGADLILCPVNVKEEFQDILECIDNGSLKISDINERCKRILFFKYLFGII